MPPASPHIELVRATHADSPRVSALLDLYAREFSTFHPVHFEPDGRFVYPQLPLYFDQPDRFAYLISSSAEIAGFALVQRGSQTVAQPSVWDMAEFFVLPEFRRTGIGAAVARQIWSLHRGYWEVRVMKKNAPAVMFWAVATQFNAAQAVTRTEFEENGQPWCRFSFEISAG